MESLFAQNYKWVKGGDINDDMGSGGNWETVKHMCTEANGNVYCTAYVGDRDIVADTFYKASAHYLDAVNPNVHLLFSSYSCNGKMRWSKLSEGASFSNFSSGLEYDGARSIYISGYLQGGHAYIGWAKVVTLYQI